MKRPPLWKITRELKRPLQQITQLPSRLGSLLLGRWYYDTILARKIRCAEGAIPAGPQPAVYLIFPSQGLQESHFIALRYLIDSGFAPVVVSNIPLGDADRQRLIEVCWLCIERPNFGYDFGGYRDGLLTARTRLKRIDRLVLLNDSSWFPLPGAGDWLAAAEALNADFAAAACNYGHPRVEAEHFRSINWAYSTANRNFQYCSFALMLSGGLMADPEFIKFWKRFPLTNNKKFIVRRGETGLTQWVMAHGFSHRAVLKTADLDQRLAQLPPDEIRQVAEETVIFGRPSLAALKARLLSNGAPAEDYLSFILTAVATQGVSYTLPAYLHAEEGFAFLKKSPCWLTQDGSDITLRFAAGLKGEAGQVFAAEARQLRQSRAADFPPALD
ncbi:lipopolysaccharide biosynthesis protein [Leisingera methylohalidivorans]|uniref:Lipopolysaccharide biosynthesis protein n=1 Tax=Leisingera methylohalidivorans DSM 14336 TaxID=999552 RepID=V9VR45_9RHOB|nr:lipopolysaccharide biosynthesis protein [Leisingera methylohalidivorans]AHC99311.1 lipopolysaccharide biosynthesis protein [Leisingera methylohalidivorans DSM 14336]